MNQGIVFFTNDDYKKLFRFHNYQNQNYTGEFIHQNSLSFDSNIFGNLILIED